MAATLRDLDPAEASAPVAVAAVERDAIAQVEAFLVDAARPAKGLPRLIGSDGAEVELPEAVFQVLRDAVRYLAQGDGITIVPYQQALTTQKAADLLGVSRPYLVRLLEAGEIPFRKVGTHRRIRYDDLMRYKAKRDAERKESLRELTRLSREYGLYEERSRQRRRSGAARKRKEASPSV